ncbi:MAG: hypothetical protein CMA12_07760 [Euryarchaeota archaeon]|nr:hypothetical protein [Euryarchaeota archaeon]OUU12525.1 MAG: hypothetical protein CBB94_00205 [Gammaproteobacteria bacterium TMED34]
MKKKIIIIGGGITGCMAALYIDKKKFDVSIYESKNNLGGVLSDFLHNEDSFLNGVQYLDVNTKWYSEIKKFFKGKLNEFSHNYGSITESENSMLFTNKFAVPAFTNVDLNLLNNTIKKNLNSRISLYPKKIANFLNLYLKKFNISSKKISWDQACLLHIGRVTILDELKKLKKLKMQNKVIDDIYAIEKKNFLNDQTFNAALPNKGYNNFFDDLCKILKKKKIKIFLKSKIKPLWDNGKLFLKKDDKQIFSADHIIWTGNPTNLIKEILNKKIDSFPLKIVQYSANIEKKVENFYAQIFSTNSNFLRFFSYKLNNKSKISVESIYDRNEINIKEKINTLLKNINFNYQLTDEKIFKNLSVRFNIVTKRDEKIFNELKRKALNTNLICGPWNIYSRNDKIIYFKNIIDKL